MSERGYIHEYPCKCSGGDICFIVRFPNDDIDISYTTREIAEMELDRLRKADD